MSHGRIWVGVDPGKSGAMAMITEGWKSNPYTGDVPSLSAEAWPIPMLDDKTYDLDAIGDWLRAWRPRIALVTVEKLSQLPPTFPGGAAQFGRGETRGWFWMLAALKIPRLPVAPQTWQKVMHRGAEGSDTKSRSISAAKSMFPCVSLLASAGSRKFHDGMADAVCLAAYGRRTRGLLEAK